MASSASVRGALCGVSCPAGVDVAGGQPALDVGATAPPAGGEHQPRARAATQREPTSRPPGKAWSAFAATVAGRTLRASARKTNARTGLGVTGPFTCPRRRSPVAALHKLLVEQAQEIFPLRRPPPSSGSSRSDREADRREQPRLRVADRVDAQAASQSLGEHRVPCLEVGVGMERRRRPRTGASAPASDRDALHSLPRSRERPPWTASSGDSLSGRAASASRSSSAVAASNRGSHPPCARSSGRTCAARHPPLPRSRQSSLHRSPARRTGAVRRR